MRKLDMPPLEIEASVMTAEIAKRLTIYQTMYTTDPELAEAYWCFVRRAYIQEQGFQDDELDGLEYEADQLIEIQTALGEGGFRDKTGETIN